MASIRTRTASDGTVTHSVLFRHGGKQTSRAFETAPAAENFRDVINAVGVDTALELAAAKSAKGRTLDSLFREWLEVKRADMTREGHRDYERQYEKWIEPKFGWRDAE